jgi:hypothetical protein
LALESKNRFRLATVTRVTPCVDRSDPAARGRSYYELSPLSTDSCRPVRYIASSSSHSLVLWKLSLARVRHASPVSGLLRTPSVLLLALYHVTRIPPRIRHSRSILNRLRPVSRTGVTIDTSRWTSHTGSHMSHAHSAQATARGGGEPSASNHGTCSRPQNKRMVCTSVHKGSLALL